MNSKKAKQLRKQLKNMMGDNPIPKGLNRKLKKNYKLSNK